ncbi:MAG TPA: 16S rRNA (cytosine(967)-C(5))-methyltransferase RsmB [Chitinispirillaceae bacterium]|nr:16S rRNA (cytosine(967)-C(5))-methyltransferase RsmB [Chitinispirillaceae bacterium]
MNKPRHRYTEKSTVNSRQLALRLLTDFDKNPGNLDRIIDKGLANVHLDHRDRRFVFEMVYGVIRRRMTLDHAMDQYVTEKIKDDTLKRILRIGIYQLIYMQKVPDHAAVNETVKLTRVDSRTEHFSGIVNAVMRALINNKKTITLPDPQRDLVERLSVEFSHPRWMIERWLKKLGLSKTKKLLSFNNERPDIFLRRKLRDISRQQFESDVRTISEPAAGYLNLYYKLKKTLLPESIRMIQQGMCVVQAPSSGWVVALLDVKKGEHLLDMCSAPGGKTALISELTGETGTVVACELRKARLMSVVEMVRRMDLNNVYPLVCDGENLPFMGAFDKVLLDAPCSGTGVLHRHPEARWVKNPEDIEKLAGAQSRLLHSAASVVAPGGILVYSTCSLEPEENELQVEAFLRSHPDFVLDRNPDVIPDKFIDDNGYLRINPYEHGMDGMFGARLRRLEQ